MTQKADQIGAAPWDWRLVSEAALSSVTAVARATELRARVRMEVAKALLNDRLHLAFQPVVALRPTPWRAFVEGLVRLGGPGETPVPAGTFMPILEDTALGEAVDCAVLKSGLETLTAHPALRLSINVGGRTLDSGAWFETLSAVHHADPSVTERLIVEVTERSALCDVDRAGRFIEAVRALGPALALDDFGAGATAFRHLRQLRFDIVKIDGAFMLGLAGSADNQTFFRSLVAIARQFDMMTVAEFAEVAEDIACASELGIDLFQGRRFGMPVSFNPMGETPDTEDFATA